MKRFIICFSGNISFFPKWLLIDRGLSEGDKRGCVYFNDYKLAKRVKEFYELHPERTIPISEMGIDPFIRDIGKQFEVLNAYGYAPDMEFIGDNFVLLLEKFSKKSFEVNSGAY